jgi:hypothetical protein
VAKPVAAITGSPHAGHRPAEAPQFPQNRWPTPSGAPHRAHLSTRHLYPGHLDPGSGGPDNDFTNRNTTFMTWNLMHLARMLKDAGGIPAHGNQRSEWDAGCRFDFDNPDYR